MEIVAMTGRLLLATVFLLSAASKLKSTQAYAAFARSLADMRIVPKGHALIALAVVTAEVTVPVLLLIPSRASGLAGLLAGLLLLTGFTAAIAVVLRRDTSVSCQCFGYSQVPLGKMHIVRNGFLIACGAAGLLGTYAASTPPSTAWLAAAPIAIAAGLLVAKLDTVTELLRS